LLIAVITLAVVFVLCAAGAGVAAFLLLREPDEGGGAAEPVAAVESFLNAVYVEQDAAAATALVCGEARDDGQAMAAKVDEVRRAAQTYTEPRYRWDPPKVESQTPERAIVATTVTLLTGDDRSAEQQLRFTVVHKTGWWVCEVG